MSSPLESSLQERRVSARRILAGGLALAVMAALSGAVVELWRFGLTQAATAARVEQQVRGDFERMATVLSGVAVGLAMDPDAARALSDGPDAARDLFLLLDRRLANVDDVPDSVAVTIYDRTGVALAWVGRPSDVGVPARLPGPSAFFVTPSPLGLRLVHILPIMTADQRRVGSIAAEHVLSPSPATATIAASDYILETPLGPASLRMRWEGAGDAPRPNAFLLHAPAGEPLVEVSIAPADLGAARGAWHRQVIAVVLAIVGVTVLLLIGPVLDRRAAATNSLGFLRETTSALLLLAAASTIVAIALAIELGRRPPPGALLLVGGVTTAAAIALLAGPVVRLRIGLRAVRRHSAHSPAGFLLAQLVAGAAVAFLLVVFARLLPHAVDPVTVDLRHFSLHPWSATRLALLTGILTCHAAALWTCTLLLSAALARWRVAAAPAMRLRIALLWIAPSLITVIVSVIRGWTLPTLGLMLSAIVCAVAALSATRLVVWYRHTTVAARILALFAAFLLPALLLYPSVDYFADGAMRRLIASQYAVQAQRHSETLQERLKEARLEIDALGAALPSLVPAAGSVPTSCESTQSAYSVWSRTALARARLTSAVELYNAEGACVSRFALNLPEYSGSAQAPQIEAASPCQWDVFGEAAPFGAEERRMLHAARQICAIDAPGAPPRVVGTIVVHVLVFDYRTLPFITSQNPYFEVFRPIEGSEPREGTTGSEVEVAIYGWSLGSVYNSPHAAWSIDEDLFARIYDPARRPFWTTVRTNDGQYRVYFSNDRVFIYAIGYRTLTVFDHLVHLAELTTLSGALYVIVLVGTALFTRALRVKIEDDGRLTAIGKC